LNPLNWGVDVVIHSATKYLGGHDDVIAGVACSSDEATQIQLKEMRRYYGGTLDPIAAWLVLRGIKTLGIRMQKQNKNGLEVSKFLEKHPKVKRVYYPGLTSHPQHQIAKKYMKGFGGVVSFEVNGSFEETKRFVEKLKLCTLAISLGGTETLVSQPVTSSHYFVDDLERKKAGITNQLVRLSLGIEDSKDIIEDIAQAFEKIEL
jgi:cystathionine beta-lyase/cystathionine gamma-synthase